MKIIISLCLIVSLSACAGTGFPGRFSETQLAENVWRVTFAGNENTREDQAEDFALLRSAKLTLENGYTHFSFTSSRSSTQIVADTTPTISYTTGNIVGEKTSFTSKPSTTNTVVMFKEKPETQGMFYDAKFVCQSIGQKYKVNCGTQK